jgi:hypothetical protein
MQFPHGGAKVGTALPWRCLHRCATCLPQRGARCALLRRHRILTNLFDAITVAGMQKQFPYHHFGEPKAHKNHVFEVDFLINLVA